MNFVQRKQFSANKRLISLMIYEYHRINVRNYIENQQIFLSSLQINR